MNAMPIRSYVSRFFALDLDHEMVGWLSSVEGGSVKAEVITQSVGGEMQRTKHLAIPSYEAISVKVGMSMSKSFYQWIRDSWDGKITRKNGSVFSLDHDLTVQHEQSFSRALVTETTLPALDGSSKEPGYMTVKFQPEESKHKVASGRKLQANFSQTQKQWLPANFSIDIDGLDCTRVNKIESLTIKQDVKRLEVGSKRLYELEPTKIEFPNLVVTFPLSNAASWIAWHEDFVIKGNNSGDKEKQASINLLTPKREELLTITCTGLGIHNLTIDKGDSGTDSVRRVKAEMYCETMALTYKR
jgi:phage tail-like protein